MLNNIIKKSKNKWLNSGECNIKPIVKHLKKGKLRDTQIEAIETYLFLKIKGKNKPLWQLFSEGIFTQNEAEGLVEEAIFKAENGIKMFALYDFAKTELPALATEIANNHKTIDFDSIIKKMFYDVSYTDYLFSLPMGAGKTYLMAAFIYLDLYFALNEPDNKGFAHNFLVLIPSGLKTSITPSLKTIENFDPSWILPKDVGQKIKQSIKFDILDVPKTAKKSNLTVNPNAQKVNNILPKPFGQVFIVNAEKVILNSKTRHTLLHEEIIENELKQKLAQVPNMMILIDEVHHASDSDIKLRQVVNWWNEQHNIVSVLGFSGTPYLKSVEKIKISDSLSFKFKHITNTIYYYPLVTAITKFLKCPTVKSANLEKIQILKQAITDFNTLYKGTIYDNGSIAKCAIYCSNIKDLEEVVYPYLTADLKIPSAQILKFHKGNTEYTLPIENETEFRSLDLPSSKKRYILLVQVGKEGWDCHSLTGVVLSGTGDSPKNMVLQTSCRCLREVDKNDNTALIWLNEANAKILNQQLKKEQNTSIDEINQLSRSDTSLITRASRVSHLKLPEVDFYQLRIKYTSTDIEKHANTKKKLKHIEQNIKDYKDTVATRKGDFNRVDTTKIDNFINGEFLTFDDYLFVLIKNSFNSLNLVDFKPHQLILKKIYQLVSKDNYLNELVDFLSLNNDINLCFSIKRTLNTKQETLPKNAQLLVVDKLNEVADTPKLYPNQTMVKRILDADKNTESDADFEKNKKAQMQELTEKGDYEALAELAQQTENETSLEVKSRDKTFHYLPYNFIQSGFEKDTLKSILNLDTFKQNNLEIYYNGERGLTDFEIDCYEGSGKNCRPVGKYTPDFLIIKRDKKEIKQVLILETKGGGFANDPNFIKRKNFMSGDFVQQNNQKFGFNKFDFLVLQDTQTEYKNLETLQDSMNTFFKDEAHAH